MTPDQFQQLLIQLTTVAAKLDNTQADVSAIKGHIAVINDGSHATAIELAVLSSKIEVWEKLLWLVISASVVAVVGAIWSLILHRRKS